MVSGCLPSVRLCASARRRPVVGSAGAFPGIVRRVKGREDGRVRRARPAPSADRGSPRLKEERRRRVSPRRHLGERRDEFLDRLALANLRRLLGQLLQLGLVLGAVSAVVEIERTAAELIDRRVLLEQLEVARACASSPRSDKRRAAVRALPPASSPAPTSSTFSMNSSCFTLRSRLHGLRLLLDLRRFGALGFGHRAKRAARPARASFRVSSAGSKTARSR